MCVYVRIGRYVRVGALSRLIGCPVCDMCARPELEPELRGWVKLYVTGSWGFNNIKAVDMPHFSLFCGRAMAGVMEQGENTRKRRLMDRVLTASAQPGTIPGTSLPVSVRSIHSKSSLGTFWNTAMRKLFPDAFQSVHETVCRGTFFRSRMINLK